MVKWILIIILLTLKTLLIFRSISKSQQLSISKPNFQPTPKYTKLWFFTKFLHLIYVLNYPPNYGSMMHFSQTPPISSTPKSIQLIINNTILKLCRNKNISITEIKCQSNILVPGTLLVQWTFEVMKKIVKTNEINIFWKKLIL